jgi:hypothetical protein
MDLLAAQQLNSKLCVRARLGALACFLAASGLLVASLLSPLQHGRAGDARGPVAAAEAPTR